MPVANLAAIIAGIWKMTQQLTSMNFGFSQNDSKSQVGGAVGGLGSIIVAGAFSAGRYKTKKGWSVVGEDGDVVATLTRLQKTLASVRNKLNPPKKKKP